jgi:hypothetical protein
MNGHRQALATAQAIRRLVVHEIGFLEYIEETRNCDYHQLRHLLRTVTEHEKNLKNQGGTP